MVRIFIFEFVSGGGFFRLPEVPLPTGSLLREGAAMLAAVAGDFARRAVRSEVTVLRDARLPLPRTHVQWKSLPIDGAKTLESQLTRSARDSDYVLIIAPELESQLLEITRLVESVGGNLISPCSSLVAWTSDKHATCQRLEAAGVPTCSGLLVQSPLDLAKISVFPRVVKPRLGAGSEGVRRVESPADWPNVKWNRVGLRVEPCYPGRPASVSLLCGAGSPVVLPPCWQRLSQDGSFAYRGGSLIQDAAVIQRAGQLGRSVAPLLNEAVGYLGIDLLLGESDADDRVVEINPRVTSSYVGIRRAIAENLADGMIAVSTGDRFDWTWRDRTVTFSP